MTAGRDGQVFADTAGLPAKRRSPNTSSTREPRVTGSTEVLATVTVKVTVAPGSGTEPAEGVLRVEMEGSTSPKATVASSAAEVWLPSSSATRAVTVS